MEAKGLICKFCLSTDFAFALDPTRWSANGPNTTVRYLPDDRSVVHQPSIASLRESALQGCPICLFFMEALEQPLRLQEPEPWGKYEANDSKRKKAKKRKFDADRKREDERGPYTISGIKVFNMHEDYALENGAVLGIEYGPQTGVGGDSVMLGVLASEDSPRYIGARDLLNHTDTGLCREWIKLCQSKHRNCPPVSESDLPTRLIDVGNSSTGVEPRLVETRGKRGQYVTLSHCWGKSKPPSTTKANIANQLHAMPLYSMPNTFRDALNLVRMLGYRYIWIDTYCIVQDDKADWERECASMATIYSNCVVTLAAPFAKDCHAGFPRGLHPTPARIWCDIPNFWSGATDPSPIRVFAPFAYYGQGDWGRSPLAERAWVLQEHLLSPRWLYFGPELLYFACCTAKFEEHLRVPLQLLSSVRVDDHFYAPKDIMNFKTYSEGLSNWYSMIHTYSMLCLTHGSDRLPALSGIASKFAAKLGDEYVAGLWRNDIVFGLIFEVSKENRTPRSVNKASVSGPSWSWYTCDMIVHPLISYNDRFTVQSSNGTFDRILFNTRECFGPMIEVTNISQPPLGKNIFGEVGDAKLTVMGRLQHIWYIGDQVYSREDGGVIGELSVDFPDIFGREGGPTVYMLPVAICGNWTSSSRYHTDRSWHALALTEVINEPNTYRRIGSIHKGSDDNDYSLDSDDSRRSKVWTWLFTPELLQLQLV